MSSSAVVSRAVVGSACRCASRSVLASPLTSGHKDWSSSGGVRHCNVGCGPVRVRGRGLGLGVRVRVRVRVVVRAEDLYRRRRVAPRRRRRSLVRVRVRVRVRVAG